MLFNYAVKVRIKNDTTKHLTLKNVKTQKIISKVTKCKQNANFYLHTFEKPRTFLKHNLHFANKKYNFAYILSFHIQNQNRLYINTPLNATEEDAG